MIEKKVSALLAKMTLEEKLQQVQLLSDGQITDADAKAGVGGVFSLVDPVKIRHFQEVAVKQSRLGIPILFAYDTIHGYRTIFPIPLGAASSFDPSVATQDHRFGARETAAVGIKQIYSPMVDVSHEPRWGRISEAGGEDPYLRGQDLAGAPRRRRAADPAGEVPRRAVRASLRRPGEGRGRAAAARRGRRRARRRGALDGPAQERGRPAAAEPRQEDRRHRPARQERP